MALFSFIGVEAAAVTAKRVKNPRLNVGRASLIGTALSAVLYVLVTAAVIGTGGAPRTGQQRSAVRQRLPVHLHTSWAGKFIAAVAVVSGIGALNGWTLITTETSRAIAQDDLFPRPFTWTDRNGTAWFGIVVGTALPSVLMLWRYTAAPGSPCSPTWSTSPWSPWPSPTSPPSPSYRYLVSRRRRVQGWPLTRDLTVAGVSVLFSMWVTFAGGYQVVYQALIVILAGLILYAFLNARRQRLGEAREPVDLLESGQPPDARGGGHGRARQRQQARQPRCCTRRRRTAMTAPRPIPPKETPPL